MPIIRIDFDEKQVNRDQIETLSKAIQSIVSDKTEIKEVFVYVDEHVFVIDADPIEVFVEMSAHIMEKNDQLMAQIKTDIQKWKSETNFDIPINLTLTPMNWQLEIGI
ncbi:MAG: hypothetical protein AAF549_03815 [Pseudomonadota bacterium]